MGSKITTRVSLVVVRGLPVDFIYDNHVPRFAQFSQWLYMYVWMIRLYIADNALCPSLWRGQKAVYAVPIGMEHFNTS